MNDKIVKWLRLIFFAIIFHAALYFATHFQMYQFSSWRFRADGSAIGIRTNSFTGSSMVVRSSPEEQPDNFDDVIEAAKKR